MKDVGVAMQFVKAINAHDVDGIAELVSLNHEFIDSLGGSVRGREPVRAAWRAYFALCPNYWIRPDEVIGGADCVAIFGEAGGTIVEVGNLLAANEWRVPAAWRAATKDGLVERWQVFADNKPVYDIVARFGQARQ